MSLINNMLKDLDQRQSSPDGGGPALSGSDVRVTAPVQKRPSPLIVSTLIVVLAGAAYIGWNQFRKPEARPTVAPAVTLAPAVTAATAPSAIPASVPSPTPVVATTRPLPTAKPAAQQIAVATQPAPPAKPAPTAQTIDTELSPANVTKAVPEKRVSGALAGQLPDIKVTSPQQRSDNLYRQAISLIQQSRTADAQQALRQAITEYEGNHAARQLLAASLVDAGRHADAAALLQRGLALTPGQSGFSMLLARLQVADGNPALALSTLEKGLADAGESGEYHAFFGTLLQGQGRHTEAVAHYIAALRTNPSVPSWLIGAGISLAAESKLSDAGEAFQRALDSGGLSPELVRFAEQQLQQIRQRQGRTQ